MKHLCFHIVDAINLKMINEAECYFSVNIGIDILLTKCQCTQAQRKKNKVI